MNAADYTVWADNFGRGVTPGGAVSVPEPEMMSTIAVVGLGLMRRRR